MKIFLKLLILFIFFFSINCVFAQTELGFRFETQILKMKNAQSGGYESTTSGLPSCLQITFAYYPFKNLALEARFGNEFGLLDLTDYYYGTEYGFYSKYFLKKYLYITAGVGFHSNVGELIHNGGARLDAKLTMPALGVGLKPWDNVGFEFLYQKANSENISSSYGYRKSLTSLMKIGVVLGWEIFLF